MNLHSGPKSERAGRVSRSRRLRAFFRLPKPAGCQRVIPPSRAQGSVHPPDSHVELRFADGTGKIVDPRSPEASALQDLADQLRQSGS